MPIFETFAKRMRKQRGDVPDVYTYDTVPDKLRVQLVQIMMETLGDLRAYQDHFENAESIQDAYRTIVEILRKERGVFLLPPNQMPHITYIEELRDHLLGENDVDEFLSAVELICKVIETVACDFHFRKMRNSKAISADAIKEINYRFKEHGIGYEYDGQLIRIDSELIHAEAVKPALKLVGDKQYAGAQQEFLSGYEHYRQQNYEEALNDALKALESTLKAIFDKQKWRYDPDRDTCSKLIQIALDNDLIPQFWQAHFTSLRTTLEAGVPTGRNKLGGHGQGSSVRSVPSHLAAYVLHMTASAIVFLVKSEEALP